MNAAAPPTRFPSFLVMAPLYACLAAVALALGLWVRFDFRLNVGGSNESWFAIFFVPSLLPAIAASLVAFGGAHFLLRRVSGHRRGAWLIPAVALAAAYVNGILFFPFGFAGRLLGTSLGGGTLWGPVPRSVYLIMMVLLWFLASIALLFIRAACASGEAR